MNKAELLSNVKVALGNIPSHLDNTITLYIEEVVNYLLSAGINPELLEIAIVEDVEVWNIDKRCAGCIIRGVSDLWNYGNGDTKLSEYFYQRADQLRLIEVVEDE